MRLHEQAAKTPPRGFSGNTQGRFSPHPDNFCHNPSLLSVFSRGT
jgi:hypothetical protein